MKCCIACGGELEGEAKLGRILSGRSASVVVVVGEQQREREETGAGRRGPRGALP